MNSVDAATIMVDRDGRGGKPCSDKNAGSPGAPVCTIQRGIALAAAGDTVVVRRGTYRFSETLWVTRSLQAYQGERPFLDFSDQPADIYFGVGVGLRGDGAGVEGFEIANTVHECLQTEKATHAVIRRNEIHDCGLRPKSGKFQNAIQLGQEDKGVLIEQNSIHDTGSHILYVEGTDITIRNNLLYRPLAPGGRGSYGIQVGTSPVPPGTLLARNVVIAHNVIGEAPMNKGARPAIILYAPTGAILDTVKIVGNIIYDSPLAAIYIREGSDFQGHNEIRNNIFAGNGGCNDVTLYRNSKDECLTSYPTFEIRDNVKLATSAKVGWADLAKHDFHLTTGSPAIDRGPAGVTTVDFDGAPRPRGNGADIGPYELTKP